MDKKSKSLPQMLTLGLGLLASQAFAQTLTITSAPYNASTGSADNAAAIQAAVNAVGNGGTVLVPAGNFLSGPITLKSNMTFQLSAGATLQMTAMGTFPTSGDLLYGSGLTNITINGSGVMDGQGAAWWTAFNNDSSTPRPAAMIYLTNCAGVTLTGITVQNSPEFHIQLLGNGSNIYASGLSITAPWPSPNTDGIDLRGKNVLIENCYISDGDDLIQLGGTQAVQGVTIRNCTFGTGHGLSIGGYTQGGVQDLLVDSCTFKGTQYGIRWKSGRDRGGTNTNLTYSNITMTGILDYPFYLTSWYPANLPPASDTSAPISATTPYWYNITLQNITASTASGAEGPGIFWAVPEAPVSNVLFDGVTITSTGGVATFDIHHARGVTFNCNCRVNGSQPPTNIGSYDATISYPACGPSPTPSFTSSVPTATTTSTTVPPTATFTETSARTNTSTTTATVTATRTHTPVNTPTATVTSTQTTTQTNTPLNTATSTATPTRTFTATLTMTATQTQTPAPPTSTSTATVSFTPTYTHTPFNTPTSTSTPTVIPPTSTSTATSTATSTMTSTATRTNTVNPPTPTFTLVLPTSTATSTITSFPTATYTVVPPTPTNTLVPSTPTRTSTLEAATSTNTVTSTSTPTNSPVPPTPTATETYTLVFTATVPFTKTSTPIPPSFTWTATETSTETSTSTMIPAATPTNTPSATPVTTPTPTSTTAPTVTQTPVSVVGSGALAIYPNPAKGPTVTIVPAFYPGVSNVRVEVYTIAFRKVQDTTYLSVPSGTGVALNLVNEWGNPLANGLYYLEVTTKSGKSTSKLLILR